MPELRDEMYCSEQISIPPLFPYLIRQYAKAAIRTQPIDLLKWSTAYFRCLALNCPPPVKLRLEHPIPTDWHGLTPGWIKTLYLQIHPCSTVHFRALWDRWIGACLEHENLIQILCLGAFTDATAIPWLRFIALCASFITGSLTETMILVCEILTDEPEGGSGIITLPIFIELYKYLANIDASAPQVFKNIYFTDDLLELWKEKREKFEEEKKAESEASSEEICAESIICAPSEEAIVQKDLAQEISCPSIGIDDYKRIEEYLEDQERATALAQVEAEEEGDLIGEFVEITETDVAESGEPSPAPEDETDALETEATLGGQVTQDTEDMAEKDKERQHQFRVEERQKLADMDERQRAEYETAKREGKTESPNFEEEGLLEDLERLKALQVEMAGESDEELEKFKKDLLKGLRRSPSEDEAISHFRGKLGDEEVVAIIPAEGSDLSKRLVEEEVVGEEEQKQEYEDVFLEAVPGIGPKVSEELVKAVEKYMKDMARLQHGMVMPRNIRHYDCPPLEEFVDYDQDKICN